MTNTSSLKQAVLTDKEFSKFQQFMMAEAGVSLPAGKQSLVAGRLMKRLRYYGLKNFNDYLLLIDGRGNEQERQETIDLLTTHETYFFREDAHFNFLSEVVSASFTNKPLRIWSAACSTGQEPYSISMILSEFKREASSWELLASDISESSLAEAKRGIYLDKQMQSLPNTYLKKYCLKGVRSQEGKYTVTKALRNKIDFRKINLNEGFSKVGRFDFIFLRNVMIYFDLETKRKIVKKLVKQLNPGGYLLVGHSETLNSVNSDISYVRPSIYRLNSD